MQDLALTSLKTEFHPIPYDLDGQVAATCELMRSYVLKDASFPLIQATAKRLKARCMNSEDTLAAIWGEARARLNFSLDQDTANAFADSSYATEAQRDFVQTNQDSLVEVLIRPADVELMTQDGSPINGDCDDFSMFSACLAQALAGLGLPISDIRFVCVSDKPTKELAHVYVKLKLDGVDRTLDCSHGPFPGWEVPKSQVTRSIEFPLGQLFDFSKALPYAALAATVAYIFLRTK